MPNKGRLIVSRLGEGNIHQGGAKILTAREGGGWQKNLDLTYIFQLTKIQCSNVSMGFGVFLNFN